LTLTPATAEVLYHDLQEWGAVALVVPRGELRALLPSKRADRLWSWVREHGTTDPRRPLPPPVAAATAPAEGRTHLVIGDCHAAPGQSMRRFEWLGRMVAELKPDVVVSVGDWYSLDSLCQHRTLADRHGDNTGDEIRAGEMALTAFEAALGAWKGRKVITLGNHDDRLKRLSDDAPWLEGLHNVGKAHAARGWEVHPFLEPARVDGIRYQHFMTKAGGKSAVSGEYHASHLLKRVGFAESVTVAHSHHFRYATFRHAAWAERGPRRVHALVAGCYFEHDEDYAGPDENAAWWRGICVLRGVRDGDYDLETWSMGRIRARWGG
jgi:hypothetical protein